MYVWLMLPHIISSRIYLHILFLHLFLFLILLTCIYHTIFPKMREKYWCMCFVVDNNRIYLRYQQYNNEKVKKKYMKYHFLQLHCARVVFYIFTTTRHKKVISINKKLWFIIKRSTHELLHQRSRQDPTRIRLPKPRPNLCHLKF